MRKPGFNGADGDNGEAEITANQAFNQYLDKNNIPKTPKNKAKFKQWLQDRKADGSLHHIVKSNKDVLTKAVENTAPIPVAPTADQAKSPADVDTAPVASSAVVMPNVTTTGKVFGMDPLVFGAVCIVAGILLYKGYQSMSAKA